MELNNKFKVVGIKKKTAAHFFKDLKVGDVFELRYFLDGYYESAPDIAIYMNGERFCWNKALQLRKNLENFELEQFS